MPETPLLATRNLSKTYEIDKKTLRALHDVTLEIRRGEIMGLVGESGCGKSTFGKTILRLTEPTSGDIFFRNVNISHFTSSQMRGIRPHLQMVFQDPYSSLNPRMRILDIVGEPFRIHSPLSIYEVRERVEVLLEMVGLNPTYLYRFPHEISGGQRQRVGIARALALRPELLVCDEPFSALDVSIQAQIVTLLKKLQEEHRLTYLLIAHDVAMVSRLSDRIAVMYLGHIVELAPSHELITNPQHPYTQALLSAIPTPDPSQERNKTQIFLQGDLPSPFNHISGCPFQTRCPFVTAQCREVPPSLKNINNDHSVACHRTTSAN